MINQIAPQGNKNHQRSTKNYPRRPSERIDVRKVPADSVPFGESISRNGRTVWAAYDKDGTLIAIAPTADQARAKFSRP